MSASLVGSEMCIRDRDMPPQHRCPPAPLSRSTSATGSPRTPRCWRTAVSYTHLTLPTICSV
eukprot:4459532-Alexandrium_andersonii.AAC.1